MKRAAHIRGSIGLLLVLGSTLAFQNASFDPLSPQAKAVSKQLAANDTPIDKSCLMVCEKWVGDTCEKFVMKCKGDPGYPTALKVRPFKRAPAITVPLMDVPSTSQ